MPTTTATQNQSDPVNQSDQSILDEIFNLLVATASEQEIGEYLTSKRETYEYLRNSLRSCRAISNASTTTNREIKRRVREERERVKELNKKTHWWDNATTCRQLQVAIDRLLTYNKHKTSAWKCDANLYYNFSSIIERYIPDYPNLYGEMCIGDLTREELIQSLFNALTSPVETEVTTSDQLESGDLFYFGNSYKKANEFYIALSNSTTTSRTLTTTHPTSHNPTPLSFTYCRLSKFGSEKFIREETTPFIVTRLIPLIHLVHLIPLIR